MILENAALVCAISVNMNAIKWAIKIDKEMEGIIFQFIVSVS